VGVAHPFASSGVPADAPEGAAPSTSQGANRLMMSEGVAYSISHRWTMNLGFRQFWTGQSTRDGVSKEGSRSRSYTTSLGASYLPAPAWRVNAGFETPFPFYKYAVNMAYSPAVSIGVAYAGI
jgi:long-subunit fatty acid transport protein